VPSPNGPNGAKPAERFADRKYGEPTKRQMEQKARVRGTPATVRSSSGTKRTEFVQQYFNAAINIRQCAVLQTRPEELTTSNFIGIPLRLKVYKEKLIPIAGGWSKKERPRGVCEWIFILHDRRVSPRVARARPEIRSTNRGVFRSFLAPCRFVSQF
jgi:hypothetical protein